ncbi:MAG TPA: hypothetical protein PLD20_22865 [Blastocatellia bacterium]|nr:hypothetical protein [Blastocatellia bacterium]HMX29562.1 hypothetical protein [Blastocatellia bacterium]HMY72044.1 hypothetical protein [Blastocatellia bacterium]HMZ20794.1 hypothetical protein [Blastocatellia bacterium]HNG30043.1 hypothetical protein [Blastocatellia bacterium]
MIPNGIEEYGQPLPPDVPPGIPIPPVPPPVHVPMVYVENHVEPVVYRVLTLSAPSAARLESELNVVAHEGWALCQIIPQDKQLLLVLSQQEVKRRKS